MSETPRTNTAAYNGAKYLHDECAALEIENRKLREALKQIAAYDEPRKDGCCEFGCDCPYIAQSALANGAGQTQPPTTNQL